MSSSSQQQQQQPPLVEPTSFNYYNSSSSTGGVAGAANNAAPAGAFPTGATGVSVAESAANGGNGDAYYVPPPHPLVPPAPPPPPALPEQHHHHQQELHQHQHHEQQNLVDGAVVPHQQEHGGNNDDVAAGAAAGSSSGPEVAGGRRRRAGGISRSTAASAVDAPAAARGDTSGSSAETAAGSASRGSAASHAAAYNNTTVDLARDLWKPLNSNQVRDMLEELTRLVVSYPSCLEQETFEPLRHLLTDAIHYPRKYIRPTSKNVLHHVVNSVLRAPPATTTAGTTTTTLKEDSNNSINIATTSAVEPEAANLKVSADDSKPPGDHDNNSGRAGRKRKTRIRPREAVTAAAVATLAKLQRASQALTGTGARVGQAPPQQQGSTTTATTADVAEEYSAEATSTKGPPADRTDAGNVTSARGEGDGNHQNQQDEYEGEQAAVGYQGNDGNDDSNDTTGGGDAQQVKVEEEEQQQPKKKRRRTMKDRHKGGPPLLLANAGGGDADGAKGTTASSSYMVENTLHDVPRVVCDRYTRDWNTRFDELEQYRIEHGHTNVPKTYESNPALGRWVGRQREQYQLWRCGRKTQLTQDRANRLSSLGFIWDAQQAAWEMKLKELEEYVNRHGDCDIPAKYPENQPLAVWCCTQRKQKKNFDVGKSSSITPARIRALDALGFPWGNAHVPFEDRVKELEAYKKLHGGSCDVPKEYPPNQPLANWASFVRKEYHKFKAGNDKASINQSKINLLNSMGFRWDEVDKWVIRYEELVEHRKHWGTTNIPCRMAKLGTWSRYQRQQKRLLDEGKPSSLTQERWKLLQDIGFDFNEYDNTWDSRFRELQQFREYFGHCNVPADHPTLTTFVKKQRKMYHKRSSYINKGRKPNNKLAMSDERVEMLESIGFEWGEQPVDGKDDKPVNDGSDDDEEEEEYDDDDDVDDNDDGDDDASSGRKKKVTARIVRSMNSTFREKRKAEKAGKNNRIGSGKKRKSR